MAESKDFKWRLTWSGCIDTAELRAAVDEVCKDFPLFRDSKAKLITHEEYNELVANREIAEPKDWWKIREGHVGLISSNAYSKYSTTWGNISQAREDFCKGWRACLKHQSR